MDISELARQTGFSAATLRFYEEKGLIASTGRKGLRRLFADSVLDRLAMIALGRVAGFSLDEIRSLLPAGKQGEIDRDALELKADELEQQIKVLGTMRDALRHAATCKAPSHLECPRFRRLMDLASRGAFSAGASVPTGRRGPAQKDNHRGRS